MSLHVTGTVLAIEAKDYDFNGRSGTAYTALVGHGADIERVKVPEKMLADFPGEGCQVDVVVAPVLSENPGNLLQPYALRLRALQVSEISAEPTLAAVADGTTGRSRRTR